MKFISKAANLHIIIRPGIPQQPITGTPAVPTISVRFQDGVANVPNPDLVEKMLAHPGFNIDFVAVEEEKPDPYKYLRRDVEPQHIITEMKYGAPEKVIGKQPIIPPELAKMINDQAIEIAKKMLPEMVEATIRKITENAKGKDSVKKKPGRPRGRPFAKKVEQPEPSTSSEAMAAALASSPVPAV